MPPIFRKFLAQALPLQGSGAFIRTIALNLAAGFGVIVVAASLSSVIQGRIERRMADTKREIALAGAVGKRYELYGDLNGDYRRLEPILPALYSAVPNPEDILVFSNAVELLARDTGNSLTMQFSGREPAQDGQFSDIALANFDATLNGTRETFEKFIAGFDNLRPIGAIEKLSMEGGQGIEGTARMSLSGIAFIMRR
ncbi:MAG: hypothetical protein AAB692_01095 [Patescibacteria group bacterium]